MSQHKLILDHVFDNRAAHPRQVYLTQPVGGGKVIDFTWDEVVDQASRMAAHLRARGLKPGAHIAILSKNCAHFFMAELAIWMAGGTTVAIFPTETAEIVHFVLEDSQASLLFVGKLDIWPQQASAVPAGMPCIALPLAPPTDFDRWDDIVARTAPLAQQPSRQPDDLAMLIYTSGSTGQPKGAMLTFEAVTRAAEGMAAYTRAIVGAVENRMLSYLPLAHSFERSWVECASLIDGRTRRSSSPTRPRRSWPTSTGASRRHSSRCRGCGSSSSKACSRRCRRRSSTDCWGSRSLGRLVRKKVLKGLGLDRVRLAASGSAPIPAELIGGTAHRPASCSRATA